MRARFTTRFGPVLVVVAMLMVCCSSTRRSEEAPGGPVTLVAQAIHTDHMVEHKLIFTGTVLGVQDADGGSRAEVRIERIDDKPAAVSLRAGQLITVLAAEPQAFEPDQSRRFVTEPVIYGDRLTVRLLSEAQADIRPLEQAIRTADIVVTGTIVEIRPAPRAAFAATDGREAPRRVTEHDPQWHDAVLEIETINKGTPAMIQAGDKRKIVVRFANSMDVRFYRMPKFTVGQQGVFLLQQDKLSAIPIAELQGQEIQTLLAPTMECCQPLNAEPRIRTMINRPPP